MGSFFSFLPKDKALKNKKRSREYPVDDSPVRKRVRSTYEYVYSELFTKGLGSDLSVKALGNIWSLHRLYVKQSPFFAAMLEGGWKESGSNFVELELTDTNIDIPSLNVIFGSFYRDAVHLSETTVLNVLAAATWFQMEDIRLLCSEFMSSKMSLRNFIDFFQISKQYNLESLSKRCIQWLGDNLFLPNGCQDTYSVLRIIPIDFMFEVIKKPDLIVVQLEQDVFLLLLKWVFLQVHPDYMVQSGSQLLEDAYSFFTSTGCSFLETPEGKAYVPTFQAIRWEYVVNVFKTTERLLRDRIIPQGWILRVLARQWLRVLHAHDVEVKCSRMSPISGSTGLDGSSSSSSFPIDGDHSSHPGVTLSGRQGAPPTSIVGSLTVADWAELPDEMFWKTSERCGRRMQSGDVTYSWRWTGYHFGFDVVIKYKRRVFSVVRFIDPHATEGAVSHAPHLPLLISLRVRSLRNRAHLDDESPDRTTLEDDPTYLVNVVPEEPSASRRVNRVGMDRLVGSASSGVLRLKLEENKPRELLRMPERFPFPAVVSVNLLRCNPIDRDAFHVVNT